MSTFTHKRQALRTKLTLLLTPHLQPMKQRWQALQQRERTLLSALAGLMLVTFVWLAVLQPLHTGVAQAQQRLESQQNYQRWLDRQAQLVYQARTLANNKQQGPAALISASELSTFLNSVTTELKLEITRIQPQNDAQVLVFNEASFDAILTLIERLANRGVVIENLDVAATSTPGVVRIRRLQVKASA